MSTPEEVKNVVAKNIQGRRNQLELTQEQLGKRLSLSREQISKAERAKTSISSELLPFYAQALETTLVELYVVEYYYRDRKD